MKIGKYWVFTGWLWASVLALFGGGIAFSSILAAFSGLFDGYDYLGLWIRPIIVIGGIAFGLIVAAIPYVIISPEGYRLGIIRRNWADVRYLGLESSPIIELVQRFRITLESSTPKIDDQSTVLTPLTTIFGRRKILFEAIVILEVAKRANPHIRFSIPNITSDEFPFIVFPADDKNYQARRIAEDSGENS